MSMSEKLFNWLHANRGLPIRSMAVFNFLLEATLCGAALILIVLLVRRFLRGKLGNRAVYFAWLLVAVRLLLPIALPNPLMNELRPTLSTDTGARPVADQVRVRFQDAMSDLSRAIRTDNSASYRESEYNASQFVQDVAAYTSYGLTGKWFLFAYLAADGLVLGYMVYQNTRFRRRLKKGRVSALDGDDLAAYYAECERRGVKRPLPVYFVDPLPSACLVGVIRPYIALPLTLKPEELRQALAHELCHHKAHDEWWGLLRNLCCVVHWFNPLVWIAARCARTDCEMACDDRVTALMDDGERIAYANALVRCAAKRNAPRMSVLATGMTMTGKRLKQRVDAIVKSKKVQRGVVIAVVAVIMCLTVFVFGTAEQREDSYDIQLDKAKYMFQLDEPFDYPAPEVEPIEVGAPLDTEEKALSYAMKVLDSRFIDRADYAERYLVSQLDGEWRVAIPGAAHACELYFDTQGYLLYFDARLYEGYNDYPFKSSDSVRASVDRYVRAFATACLGDFPLSAVTLDADYYDLNGRYAYGQALGESGDSVFTYTLDLSQMRIVRYQDSMRAQFAGGTLFAQAVDNLRDSMTETSVFGETEAADFEAGTLSAERGADGSVHVRLVVNAADLTDAARRAILERCGEAECYLMEYVTTQYGERVDGSVRGMTQAEAEAVLGASAVGVGESYTLRQPMDVYFDVERKWLNLDETLLAGAQYELLQTVLPGEHAFETEWANERAMLYIRYDSPKYGYERTGWIVDPNWKAVANTGDAPAQDAPSPVPAADPTPEPTAISLNEEDGVALRFELYDATGFSTSYGRAPDGAIPLGEAIAIAVRAICEKYTLPRSAMENFRISYAFTIDPNMENTPYWWLSFIDNVNNDGGYSVGVHSPDGVVVHLSGPEDSNG